MFINTHFLVILTATNLVQGFAAAPSNGSVSYRCTFALNAPIQECVIVVNDLDGDEVTTSHAINNVTVGIAENTTETLCNGRYQVACNFVLSDSTSKNTCSVGNRIVDIKNSSKACSSSTVSSSTYYPTPSFTITPTPQREFFCKRMLNRILHL